MKTAIIQRFSLVTKQILLFFILGTLNVSGQKPANEYTVFGGGGLAAFSFRPSIKNNSSMGFGGDAGVGYTAFFNQNWGIHIDAGLGFFNVKNKVDEFLFITPDQKDCENYLFDLHTTLHDYKETHKAFFLTVPLMLQYQTNMGQPNSNKNEKMGYYAMAGVKACFPFNYYCSSEMASYDNAAYYSQFDNWIYSLPILGLGSFDGNRVNEKLKFDVLPFMSLETGAKWRIKSGYLYTGVYFDYGLFDPARGKRIPYSVYNHPELSEDITLMKFTNKTNLIAAGIKIRLAFFRTQNSCSYKWWSKKNVKD